MSFLTRMSLPPLSVEGVGLLAEGTGIDPAELHERTGGNPLYVTEIVGSGRTLVPESTLDAVLGRASRLSLDARAVLDISAAIGPAIDTELLSAVFGAPIESALEECLTSGLLMPYEDGIAFRHELTRDVFHRSMSSPRRRGLHRRILEILERDSTFSADLTHLALHAEEGANREAVLRYAPALAAHAVEFGAHREAAAQYARTLRFAQGMDPADLAELLESKSFQRYLTGQLDEAHRMAKQTGELLRPGPLSVARAEAAWLAGDSEGAASEAQSEIDNAVRAGDRWLAGNLALWLHRGGRKVADTTQIAEPFALEIQGDGVAAARDWRIRGHPLEEARANMAAGDEGSLRAALRLLNGLAPNRTLPGPFARFELPVRNTFRVASARRRAPMSRN